MFYAAEEQAWPGIKGRGKGKEISYFLSGTLLVLLFFPLSLFEFLGLEREGGPGCIHILVGPYCLLEVNQGVLRK